MNLEKHSDGVSFKKYYGLWTKNVVGLWWIRWNDTKGRKSRKLAEYVEKEKDSRGMKIPTIEFQRDLINELWAKAGLTKMSDKIAMWMYLTWNYGCYRLSTWYEEKSNSETGSRSRLLCLDDNRWFGWDLSTSFPRASLCMIACN